MNIYLANCNMQSVRVLATDSLSSSPIEMNMQNLLNDLKLLLEKDPRFMAEGKILKNAVVEAALKPDAGLVKMLLNNQAIREHFFLNVDGTLVFDKVKFQDFVSNKQFLPDSYTAFKNKIGLFDRNNKPIADGKDVVLAWAYKDCVLEGGMTKEEAKRDEIFYNTTLAPDEITRLFDPKVLTKFEYWDQAAAKVGKPKSVRDITQSENLLVKGNNLLALHCLKQRYTGKIKLIYIDPPYNTGSDDFRYNDTFSRSTWLTFIKNRIEASKDLLSPEGVFVMQLSDHRVAEGKLLLDEIFGRENFINQITVKTRSPSGFKTVNLGAFESAEYLYFYAKNKGAVKSNPQYVKTEYDRNYKFLLKRNEKSPETWVIENIEDIVSKELGFQSSKECKKALGSQAVDLKMAAFALQNASDVFRYTEINDDASKDAVALREKSKNNPQKIYIVGERGAEFLVRGGKQIYFYKNKIRSIDGENVPSMLLSNIWTDISWEGIANEGGVKMKQGKKPERLMKRILDMYTHAEDVVLDYFAGSGTTCAVAHKTGRRWIAVEQLDYIKDLPESRLRSVVNGDQTGISKIADWNGGGDFIYCEIMEWNERYIQPIRKAKTTKELLKVHEDMKKEAFFRYDVDISAYQGKDFEELPFADQQKALISCLEMNHLYVNYSEIDDKTYAVSGADKKLNRQFYGDGGKD